jgi:hypothetical protein
MKDTFPVVSMSCRFMTDQVVGIVYPEAASLTREDFPLAGDCIKVPSVSRFYGDLAAGQGSGWGSLAW